eukprot:7391488-Prymnesium_polylepis.2
MMPDATQVWSSDEQVEAHTQHSPPELSSGWPCGTGKHPDVTAIFEKGCSKHPDATIGTIAHTVEAQSAVSLLRTHEALAETDLAAAVAGAGSRVDATAAKYNTLMAMPSKTKSHQGPRKLHLWQLRPGGQHAQCNDHPSRPPTTAPMLLCAPLSHVLLTCSSARARRQRPERKPGAQVAQPVHSALLERPRRYVTAAGPSIAENDDDQAVVGH